MNPHLSCLSTEKGFLGCVVASKGAVLDSFPATPEHFSSPGVRTVFEAALWLHQNGSPVSSFTVRQKLPHDEIEKLGGELKLAEMCQFPSPSMAGYLFGILNQKVSLRRAYDMVQWATSELENPVDPDAFYSELSARSAGLSPESETENVKDACIRSIHARLDRIDRGEIEKGYKTPLDVWDKAFGGILEGQLYALAGRPGTGKTAMMEQLIETMLYNEAPVVVFEKDMSPEKLMARIACRGARIPFWRYSRGTVSRSETAVIRQALGILSKVKLFVYNPVNLTAEKMCSIVRRDVRLHGVKAVFLDHVQALRVGKSDLREGLTQASLAIRSSVTETNVPHVVLAHINRNGAKGRPSPEDIKEFDQLYGDCDGMALLWSEKSRAELEPGELLDVNFYVAKNRDGEVTEDSVLFDGANLTFKNKAREQ